MFPEPDGTFRAEIIEFPGCIAVGDTASRALANLEDVAASWLESVIANNQRIPEPIDSGNGFSGKLVLRLPKTLHKKAARVAEQEGISLNQFIMSSVAEHVGERTLPATLHHLFLLPAVPMVPVRTDAKQLLTGSPNKFEQFTALPVPNARR